MIEGREPMRLHWVTWGLIALAVIEVGGGLFFGLPTLERARIDAAYGNEAWAFGLRAVVQDVLYGLTWVGTAGMYEMLYRIWRSLSAPKPGLTASD
jgi:hypothetical protein